MLKSVNLKLNQNQYISKQVWAFLFSSKNIFFRAKAWLKAAGREDLQEKNLKNYKLCEDHFETKFISVSSSGFKRLYDTAVPTKFLKPSSSRNEDIFEQPPKKITILSGKQVVIGSCCDR